MTAVSVVGIFSCITIAILGIIFIQTKFKLRMRISELTTRLGHRNKETNALRTKCQEWQQKFVDQTERADLLESEVCDLKAQNAALKGMYDAFMHKARKWALDTGIDISDELNEGGDIRINVTKLPNGSNAVSIDPSKGLRK